MFTGQRSSAISRVLCLSLCTVFATLSAVAQAAPVLNLGGMGNPNYTATATAANVKLNGTTPSTLTGTATSLMPALAGMTSTFIPGNFIGTAPTNQTFQSAFNNWNVANGAANGGMWAIINGGNLDITFNVTDRASASTNSGGIKPFTVTITKNADYTGPALNQLTWTQGLYINYQPGVADNLNPPANTLDTYTFNNFAGQYTKQPIPGQTPGPNNNTPTVIGATNANSAYADPIYPFQDGNQGFGDSPMGLWATDSFRAIALLSTVTFKTDATGAITERDLTVYNGLNWGFDLAVPEPQALLLLIPILLLIAMRRRSMLMQNR